MLDLSIVIPTCNRSRHLVGCEYEVIVVDGASDDDTPDVLLDAKRSMRDSLRIIREDKREGFVRAANKGFRAARGRNITWCNDDARPLPGALDNARLAVGPRDVGKLLPVR